MNEYLTRITGTLPEDQYKFYIIYLSVLLRMMNVSDNICTGNQNIHLCSINFFFRKSSSLWDNVEKSCGVGQATDDNIMHAHCAGYLRIQTHIQNM